MVNTAEYRDSTHALTWDCLPRYAPNFTSHWAQRYNGQPPLADDLLCLGPCYYGDLDNPQGHVLQLPTESVQQYTTRIHFLQAAWHHQQADLITIFNRVEETRRINGAYPYPVHVPYFTRRLPDVERWTHLTHMVYMPPHMDQGSGLTTYGAHPPSAFLDFASNPPPIYYMAMRPRFMEYITPHNTHVPVV